MKIIEVNQVEAKWRGSPLASTIVFFRDCNREKKLNQENFYSILRTTTKKKEKDPR